MQQTQYSICRDFKDHPLIQIKENDVYYPIIKTVGQKNINDQSDEQLATWQLQLVCFDLNGHHIQIMENNCQDILLSNQISKLEIRINQISVNNKKHIQQTPICITTGKNIGKKNETTIFQQALILCDKKYENMLKKKQNNNLILPMLLSNYAYVKRQQEQIQFEIQKNVKVQFPLHIQRKLDGLRCIYADGQLFSRGQKLYTNLNHILQQIAPIQQILESRFKKVKINFDGELYIHGKNLRELNSLIRNGENNNTNIIYNIFDVDLIDIITNEQAPVIFNDRLVILNAMSKLTQELNIQNIQIVETYLIQDKQQLETTIKQFLDDHYEGAVIRIPSGLYEYSINGKRSKNVLKCKQRLDIEVDVKDYTQGNGKDTGAIIWKCSYQNGDIFNVVQNITLEQRKKQYQYLQQTPEIMQLLIQIPLMIEYSEMSEDDIPQQPRAIMFRFDKSTQINNELEDILQILQLI